jgi:phosphoribosylformimino-5-aminoimidazole carboxamide ribotide isomerase
LIRLVPVIDVLNRIVVRGVGGRRDQYRPVVSRLTASTDPCVVAQALISAYRPAEIYLADLDCILGAAPAIDLYRAIGSMGVRLFVDTGVTGVQLAEVVAGSGCEVVASLETVPSPAILEEIVRALGADRVVFSLDLRGGRPIRNWPIAADESAIAVVSTAIDAGVTRLIVLDLSRVGGGTGIGTEELCRQIASTYPHVDLLAGGGIAGVDDLLRLEACGVKGALVASALHDGRIEPDDYFRHS